MVNDVFHSIKNQSHDLYLGMSLHGDYTNSNKCIFISKTKDCFVNTCVVLRKYVVVFLLSSVFSLYTYSSFSQVYISPNINIYLSNSSDTIYFQVDDVFLSTDILGEGVLVFHQTNKIITTGKPILSNLCLIKCDMTMIGELEIKHNLTLENSHIIVEGYVNLNSISTIHKDSWSSIECKKHFLKGNKGYYDGWIDYEEGLLVDSEMFALGFKPVDFRSCHDLFLYYNSVLFSHERPPP